jgi:peptidoglycan-associated lipoprotein
MEESRGMSKGTNNAVWLGLGAIILTAFVSGCAKTRPLPPPPPPLGGTTVRGTGSNKPGATFTAEPSSIDRGQSALLRWAVENSNYVSIDTFGAVQPNGERRVTPYETTTYHLTADGPGGRFTAEATVTVNPGNPVPPPPSNTNTSPMSNLSLTDRLAQQVQDAFFAYGEFNISDESRSTLTRDAEAIKNILRDFPSASLIIEGHCDERGSAEFNLGLGDRRATAAKETLVGLGVPGDKLRTVSYGKERPQCTEQTEECYARNRRAHITAAQ